MPYYLLAIAYLLTTTTAIVLFKLGAARSSIAFASGGFSGNVDARVVIGVVLYALSFGMWLALLAARPVAYIVPLMTGTFHVLLVIASITFLHEKISTAQLCGIGLIVTGTVLLSLKSV